MSIMKGSPKILKSPCCARSLKSYASSFLSQSILNAWTLTGVTVSSRLPINIYL